MAAASAYCSPGDVTLRLVVQCPPLRADPIPTRTRRRFPRAPRRCTGASRSDTAMLAHCCTQMQQT